MDDIVVRDDLGERVTVRVALTPDTFVPFWEIIDCADGRVLESSWADEWRGYDSLGAAWREGLSRLIGRIQSGSQAPAPLLTVARPDPTRPERCLAIVARHAIGLHDALRAAFSDPGGVEIVRDRRFGERRRVAAPRRGDRRRGDRRARPDIALEASPELSLARLFDLLWRWPDLCRPAGLAALSSPGPT